MEGSVDERAWLECTDPEAMLKARQGKTSERKLRLFVCACCRRVWHKLSDPQGCRAVEIAERLADGQADPGEVAAARAEIEQLLRFKEQQLAEESQVSEAAALYGHLDLWPLMLAESALGKEATTQRIGYAADFRAEGPADGKPLVDLVHDIFGNPFRPAALDPAWLTWHDGLILQLGQVAYDEHQLPSGHLDLDRLAVLDDALEEAGCASRDILDHLRGQGPHTRGCWCVDLCLGRS
jgi:hypothetical protein